MSIIEIIDKNFSPTRSTQGPNQRAIVQPLLGPTFYVMWNWLFVQTDVLMAVALFIRLFALRVSTAETASHPAFSSAKKYIDGVLIILWTSLMIACLAISSSSDAGTTVNVLFKAMQTYRGLSYARLALQILVMLDIAISSRILSLEAKKFHYSDKTITHLLVISAVLLLRAFFLISLDIVQAQSASSSSKINYDRLNLASTVLEGLLMCIAVSMFLSPPIHEIKERRNE